jgi:hypothetical protein
MCQLQYIDEIGKRRSWLDEKLYRVFRRVKRFRRRMISCIMNKKHDSSTIVQLDQKSKHNSEFVRIRSKAEIKRSLNRSRRTGGCLFQNDMYDYCGKEYAVFKKVDHFYDEYKKKMCKCKNVYLLEGNYCNLCDRHCFNFWHGDWLEKL